MIKITVVFLKSKENKLKHTHKQTAVESSVRGALWAQTEPSLRVCAAPASFRPAAMALFKMAALRASVPDPNHDFSETGQQPAAAKGRSVPRRAPSVRCFCKRGLIGIQQTIPLCVVCGRFRLRGQRGWVAGTETHGQQTLSCSLNGALQNVFAAPPLRKRRSSRPSVSQPPLQPQNDGGQASLQTSLSCWAAPGAPFLQNISAVVILACASVKSNIIVFTIVKLGAALLQVSSFLSVSHLMRITRIKLDDAYKTFAQFLPWNKQTIGSYCFYF